MRWLSKSNRTNTATFGFFFFSAMEEHTTMQCICNLFCIPFQSTLLVFNASHPLFMPPGPALAQLPQIVSSI